MPSPATSAAGPRDIVAPSQVYTFKGLLTACAC
jgi:hypothetical protein